MVPGIGFLASRPLGTPEAYIPLAIGITNAATPVTWFGAGTLPATAEIGRRWCYSVDEHRRHRYERPAGAGQDDYPH